MIRISQLAVASLIMLAVYFVPAVFPAHGTPSPSQTLPWPFEISTRAFEKSKQIGYLTAVLDLLDRDAEARAAPDVTELYLDILGTHLALVGEHARAMSAGDEAYGKVFECRSVRPAGAETLKDYSSVDAVEAIIARAKTRKLVMVNEEHRSSVQRAFTNRLLAPLRELGFGYLAVEAVSESAHALNKRGYPVLATGTYTRDPAFGDLIRRAIELGYTIVAYEASPEQRRPRKDDKSPIDATNRRERAQARNIFDQTFQKDPDARVLVFAGRDHFAEITAGEWIPMGVVLKELSGIDPLTINQTLMTEHSHGRFEHWIYKKATEAGLLIDKPVLLIGKSGSLWSLTPGAVDASLFHPRTRYEHGRPRWMRMGGLRQAVHFKAVNIDRPVLLQAHLDGESSDAIPVDQVILWPGEPKPALMLRSGRYMLRVLDRDGKELQREQREVP